MLMLIVITKNISIFINFHSIEIKIIYIYIYKILNYMGEHAFEKINIIIHCNKINIIIVNAHLVTKSISIFFFFTNFHPIEIKISQDKFPL